MERGIAVLEPGRRPAVQRTLRLAQQRGIDAVAHQRMGKGETRLVRPDQSALDEPVATVRLVLDDMPERIERKPLADDRSGLDRDYRYAVHVRYRLTQSFSKKLQQPLIG